MDFFGYTGQIGPSALLAGVIGSILWGKLVPARVMNERVADRDAQIARLVIERDDWKASFHTVQKSLQVSVHQVDELLEGARVSQRIAESLPRIRNE